VWLTDCQNRNNPRVALRRRRTTTGTKIMKKAAQSAYAAAGVDIDEMMQGLRAIKADIRTTNTAGVCSQIGSFGGLFRSPGRDHLLVASTDGVGTKLAVATAASIHHTVGQDLVNHCTNDILVQGARPLFFLDYLGTAKLSARTFAQVVKGLCKACRENGCALLGGETAEMPGLYPEGEYDLVGTIIGSVPARKVITGESIKPGDIVIGLPSTGLHTNGYSLARKILFKTAGLGLDDFLPGTKQTVGKLLLAIHRSYLKPITALLDAGIPIQGMAHITGGGLLDNIPRILPDTCRAVIDTNTWPTPPIYTFMEKTGKVDHTEMFRVFNMGIGYTIIVRPQHLDKTLSLLAAQRAGARVIGYIDERGRNAPVALLN
jgi:phosphoribosylformylglycinamidine cyclo-ligase